MIQPNKMFQVNESWLDFVGGCRYNAPKDSKCHYSGLKKDWCNLCKEELCPRLAHPTPSKQAQGVESDDVCDYCAIRHEDGCLACGPETGHCDFRGRKLSPHSQGTENKGEAKCKNVKDGWCQVLYTNAKRCCFQSATPPASEPKEEV